MSRAFVSESDGWRRCAKYKEDCMMADEHGNCVLDHCRQYTEKDKKEKNPPPKEKQPK
ncbi:MAG: hypothetical protein AAGU27_23120 [Dehalobacterium sp.]